MQHDTETEGSARRRSAGRTRALVAAFLLMFSVVPFLALSTGASAATYTPSRSTQADVAGFPLWYQDVNGVRVQPCIDPADANCAAAPSPTYNPAQPLSFPGNYPNEFFYSAVDSQAQVFNDCQVGTPVANPGVVVRLALEGAFLNGTLTPGDQMVFGRIRIKALQGAGLCANSWYTFRTPYGPVTLQTDPNGAISGAAASASTIDVGCLPGPATPCNYDLAVNSQVLQAGLLRSVAASPGYLGAGPAAFGPVTGSASGFNQVDVVKWPAGVVPGQGGLGVDCTDVNCSLLGSTPNFAVSAKIAGPFTSSVSTVDFGGSVVGAAGVSRTITLTSVGGGALGLVDPTLDNLTITGANSADYSITSSTCALGATVARDATCDVVISYNPFNTGTSPATLNIFGDGSATPTTVTLNGTGTLVGQAPVISVAPFDAIDFGAVRITTVSGIQNVTITNTGNAPLQITPTITGVDPAFFSIATNTCPTGVIPAGQVCVLGIKFVPTQKVPYAALLELANNAGPVYTVGLAAHGTGGIAAVGPTNVTTFPDWYQDENGVRLGQCDDAANPLCITSLFQGPTVWPTNYPSEAFYYLAQSSPFGVQDPACGATSKQMFVTMGAEQAFLGQIAPNLGTTFGRIRIVSHGGLCPNTTYQITYPYGQQLISTDSQGTIKAHAGTTDVGCLGAPCDYSLALSAPVFEGFLQQTVHPDGYLGAPLAPSAVTGAPFIDETGVAANYMKVQRVDNGVVNPTPIGYTEQFTVSGRLVGPMVASPAAQDFGAIQVNTPAQAVTQTITFLNNGSLDNVTLAATPLTVTGAVADYVVTATTCTAGMVLAPAASCTADVRFLPTATGPRDAALVLNHSGKNNPLSVSLSGIGNSAGGTAAIAGLPSSVKFTDLHIGSTSESQSIVISNQGGSAALNVGAPTVSNPAYSLTGNTCTGTPVAQGGTCVLSVQFHPGAVGAFNATLTVPSNAASGTLSIPLSGKATNVAAALSASSNIAGFPNWIQDRNGVRVEQCIAQDQNCVLLQDPGFNPALPIVWSSNFPLESFFALADSEIVNVPAQSCADGSTSAGGSAIARLATEGTFAGVTQATPGAQTLFNRVRIVASGLCANTTYSFQHPYGVSTLTTDGAGAIKAKAGTVDNANVVGSAPVTPGFVQWDPNVAPAAPAGYLGDGRTFHKIVGSQATLVPGGAPTNFFRIVGPSGIVGQTDKFLVSGRLAGPIVSSLATKDFGAVETAKTATQAFTFTNVGSTAISAFAASLTGVDASQFTITVNTCQAATVLNTDQSCSITVRFNPTAVGVKNATLTLTHNGLRSPVTVALTGTGIAPASPALTVTPTSIAFGSQIVGVTTASQTFTISNPGTGDLRLGTLSVTGPNATRFSIVSTTCPNGPGAAVLKLKTSCTVNVTFTAAAGANSASIVVSATDAVTTPGHVAVVMNPVTVALTGTGAAGTISASPTTVSIGAVTGKTQTATVKLSNTGTAPFSLTGNPSVFFTAVSANSPLTKFTVGQTGCNNVAPGKNCSVTISFTPGAGTVPTSYSVNLVILSNASNSTLTIPVVGTRTK